MKLNLGSGPEFVPGFINLDNSPNLYLRKLTWLKKIFFNLGLLDANHLVNWDKRIVHRNILKLNYPRESIDFIYSSHFLEHIFFYQAQELLRNCLIMLRPKGMLRLALPDYDLFIDEYLAKRSLDPYRALLEFEERLLSHPLNEPNKLENLVLRSSHVHKWHPTKGFVFRLLTDIGFKDVSIKNYREGNFPDLDIVENRSEYTFYVEAFK